MSDAGRPTVLRSLRSTVLLDRRGDLELARECRGAVSDWGGVLGQLVRLTGTWRLSVRSPDGTFDLPSSLRGATVEGELFESHHEFGGVEAVQQIVPLAHAPGAARVLSLRSGGPAPVTVAVGSSFVPFLLPVLVEGIRPVSFELEADGGTVRARHRGFALEMRTSPRPTSLDLDGTTWTGARRVGPVGRVGTVQEVRLEPGVPTDLHWELVGGLERDLRSFARDPLGGAAGPSGVAEGLRRDETAWEAATPQLGFPDAPELERAYALARTGLRRLYTEPGDGLTGLAAGFPWYAAVWCRDVAWMLPAVVWMGDLDWAERSVASVLRYQAASNLPIVGGELGELPMQIAPGPIFFYGTSDTTLYYPALALRLVRHGLDPGHLAPWHASLERAIAWGLHRTDPATGLLRHGGEAAEVAAAAGSLARVRYGIDAVDTTIWDSADRRDHAIDVQVLWIEALRAAAELGLEPTPGGRVETLRAAADRLAATVQARYGWADEGYLYDSIRAGAPVPKLRPNALRAVSAGVVTGEAARSVVRRAAATDLSTDWGVRTLSSRDAGFSPEAYHEGQVWPIATAWAADAAFAAGETELAAAYLGTIARMLVAEDGGANECYRGDRPEPFDSCFLLGLSLGPFLSVLFERLWGLAVEAREPSLSVRPAFPAIWRRATIAGLRVGDGRVRLDRDGPTLTVAWDGDRPLRVSTALGRTTVDRGTRATLALP